MNSPFQMHPGVNIYLQNNGDHFGNILSSAIITCDVSRDEAENRSAKLVKFIGKKTKYDPISWASVMKRESLFSESYEDEQSGDLLRDDCKLVRSIDAKGGSVFGGFDMMKYSHDPSIDEQDIGDARSKWTRPTVVVLCKHKNQHDCKVELHKDTIERLETMQDIVLKTFLREEIKEWSGSTSKKGKLILEKTKKLLAQFSRIT
jgi:hypothetical protein